MRPINKRGFEFSFGWLFAILVGAVVIFLAVFAAIKLTHTMRQGQQAMQSKSLGIILGPLETSIQSGIVTEMTVNEETRIYNNCSDKTPFGSQGIRTSVKSGVGPAWDDPGPMVSFNNRYIFSNYSIQGKKFYVLSKPFALPFKIADILIMWPSSQPYCFKNAPSDVQSEFTQLNLKEKNVYLESEGCPTDAVNVCFASVYISQPDCDVKVNTATGTVSKTGSSVNYVLSLNPNDKYALMYAAIFSDPLVYNCHTKRLARRAASLAKVYKDKSAILTPTGCGSQNMQTDLSAYENFAKSASSIANSNIYSQALRLKSTNDQLICTLF